ETGRVRRIQGIGERTTESGKGAQAQARAGYSAQYLRRRRGRGERRDYRRTRNGGHERIAGIRNHWLVLEQGVASSAMEFRGRFPRDRAALVLNCSRPRADIGRDGRP